MDARPSDALALAVRTGSPIYAAEEVLGIAGIALPADIDIEQHLGRGLDDMIRGIEEGRQRFWGERESPEAKERHEKARQELMDFRLWP